MVGRLKRSRSKAVPIDQTEDGLYRVVPVRETETAKRLKAAFIATKQYYTGVKERLSKKSDKVFNAAVKLCLEFGESPEDFCARQLREAHLVGAPLYPQALLSRKLALRADLATEQINRESVAYYTLQLDLLRSRSIVLSTLPVETLLSDPHSPFSPLFRYCMATRLGLGELAERYRADARIELRLRPVAGELFQPEASTVEGPASV
jgi:hypothetical protein